MPMPRIQMCDGGPTFSRVSQGLASSARWDMDAEAMGQGVRNMKVRVSALGGQIDMRPAGVGHDKPGTLVLADLPLMRAGIEDDDDMMEAAQ